MPFEAVNTSANLKQSTSLLRAERDACPNVLWIIQSLGNRTGNYSEWACPPEQLISQRLKTKPSKLSRLKSLPQTRWRRPHVVRITLQGPQILEIGQSENSTQWISHVTNG